MKNLFLFFTIGAIFALVACGNGGNTGAAGEEATNEEAEPIAHVCNDMCTEEACNFD